jgi:hypothetical protein
VAWVGTCVVRLTLPADDARLDGRSADIDSERISVVGRRFDGVQKPFRNDAGARDGRADHDAPCAFVKRAPGFGRRGNVPFGNDGNMNAACQFMQQGPVEGVVAERVLGVAVQGGADKIHSRFSGGNGFFQRGAIGHDGEVKFPMDTLNQLPPRFAEAPGAGGAIEGDNAGSRLRKGLG